MDSYRPGQEPKESPLDDPPMQDVAETDHPPKRRRAADGDFYRPSLRPRPLPPYEPPAETDAGHNTVALGRRRSPQPSTTRPQKRPKLPKAERKQIKLAKINSKIKRVRWQLTGHWGSAQLRLETERLLAGFQADLKAWQDRDSKNAAQKRYNTVRLNERRLAEKELKKARSIESYLQTKTLDTYRKRLKDVLVTVSDDEEEGGVLLTEAPTHEKTEHGATTEQRPAPSSNSSRRRRKANLEHAEIQSDPAYLRLQGSELEKALAEAKHQLHIAEVDINYCYFAPLDQQYICLFQTDEYGRIFSGNDKSGKKTKRPLLDPEKELKKDTEAGILRSNLGSKPPLWDEIEERMKLGLFKGLTDTLGLGVDEYNLTEVGGKVDALERAMEGSSLKRRHSWMDDEISPEDLDSEGESDSDDDDNDDDDGSETLAKSYGYKA